MARKAFFREREAGEIAELNPRNVYNQRSLVERIADLGHDDAIVLRTRLIPGRYFAFSLVRNGADASRVALKHGGTLRLNQPETYEAALCERRIPVAIRNEGLVGLGEMDEQEIGIVGYSFRPIVGRDKRLRRVPFYVCFDGAKISAYEAEIPDCVKKTLGKTMEDYSNVRRVALEGGEFLVRVPSRQEKARRYAVRLSHVPVVDVPEKRVVAYSLRSGYGEPEAERREGEVPRIAEYHRLRFTRYTERGASDVFTFIPHDVAAYFDLANQKAREHNLIPMEQCQFAFPSRFAVEEVWRKLGNNVLAYDPTLSGRDKVRKLHLAEKSILIARAVGVYGPEDVLYWDIQRDGRISDYAWNWERRE